MTDTPGTTPGTTGTTPGTTGTPGTPEKSSPTPEVDPLTPVPLSLGTRWFLWIFSVIMLLTAGLAFIFKLIEFFSAFLSDESVRFGVVPLLTYLIVAAGYGCLFAWSYLRGHYKDVEAAKYRMLQMQDEIDAMEGSTSS